jgi:adenylate cyclase
MAEERPKRRLAAILAADVVGYSRMMQVDEAGTLASLKSRRSEVLRPAVDRHRGRIVKFMGDGVLVEFASAVDAVECAIQLQQGMEAASTDLPEDRRIRLRIGINLGDVMVEGNDLYGDGVNIAARLESLADPGSVIVSRTVFNHVHGKVKLGFDDLGEHELKNIAEPVRIYRLRPDGEAVTPRPVLLLPDKPSIAVLPFQNMSGDPAQEYFADGMVDDIITALSRFQNLFVIARNSTFTYKGRPVEVKQVGRELGVRYVLEGSVRKSGERLRITGQLIDASTGGHLWVERFDGAVAEVFDLQDRVATSVAGAIAPRLEAAEIERSKRKPTGNLDAYDYYLRGLAIANKIDREANEESLQLFKKAIERDPDFALAYARGAYCYCYRKANNWIVNREKEVTDVVWLARRAVELGRDDAVALSFGGHALAYVAGKLDDGNALVERALALNSNFGTAWAARGWMKICLGEPDKAIEDLSMAMRLSPLDPRLFVWHFFMSLSHYCAGRYGDAVEWAEKALRDQPNFASALRMLAAGNALRGSVEDAHKIMLLYRQLDPELRASRLEDVMPPFHRAQDRSKYVEGLRMAGLPE